MVVGSPKSHKKVAFVCTVTLVKGIVNPPQSGIPDATLSNPFVARVTDQYGNPVANEVIDFSITSQPGGATGQALSNLQSGTNANGEASSKLTDAPASPTELY